MSLKVVTHGLDPNALRAKDQVELSALKKAAEILGQRPLLEIDARALEALGVPKRHHAAAIYLMLAKRYPDLIPSKVANAISRNLLHSSRGAISREAADTIAACKLHNGAASSEAADLSARMYGGRAKGLDADLNDFLETLTTSNGALGYGAAELERFAQTQIHLPDTGSPASMLDATPALHPSDPGAAQHPAHVLTSLVLALPKPADRGNAKLHLARLEGDPVGWCYLAPGDQAEGTRGGWVPLAELSFAELAELERVIARLAKEDGRTRPEKASLTELAAELDAALARERGLLLRALESLEVVGRVEDKDALRALARDLLRTRDSTELASATVG